ncbi:mucin-16-like [Monodelphis domestica]|uniref:mucin-16-like n=2 Tax=Monodelphis domestica TaxID=13616 RepID=UPI0024E248AC|nr:mucin-16-like [Monodelphis domestica]
MRHTTLEPGSAALTSTATSTIPTLSGEDANTPLLSIEGPTEDKTVSRTFPENLDTPGITHREHYFTGPGITFQPDMASTSLANLSEGISYSRIVPSSPLESRKSTAMFGIWISPAEPLTLEPKKPTPPEGSPVTEFSSRESGHLQNSLATGSTTESDISTLIPGNFHPSEGTANLISSPVEGSIPKASVYTSLPHTSGTTGTRIGEETDSSLVLTTPAPAVSISSISGALLGTRTVVPWSSNSAEATDLTMNRLDPISMLPSKFSTSSPVTFSGVTYKAEDKSSNVPGTDSISIIFSSKVTDRVSLHPEITPNQNLLGTMEESTGALLTPSLPGPPGSSAANMGSVSNMSGTNTGSTPQVTLAYEILTRDLEKTSNFPLAMENTTKTVPAKMMGNTSMASMSTDAQVGSALLLTTTSSPVALPGQSTVPILSTIAEAGALTITGTDSTPTWQSTHSSSTTITSSKDTPMTKNMRSASPRTHSKHLISSTKITDIVPFSPVVTLSHKFPSSVVENNTDAPLTTPKSPVVSDTHPGGSLVTSADSAVLGTTAHGEPHEILEKGSTLSVNTFTTKIREHTVTAKVIEGSTLAPPRINTGVEGRSSIPFTTNLGEIPKSSEAVTPRDTSPSYLWLTVTTVSPFHIGLGIGLDAVFQAELSEIQGPLIIIEIPQESDAGFPLSFTATEATRARTITSSTLISGLVESQSSIGSISGTEAIRDSPTLFSPLESTRTHATRPEYALSSEQALSTVPTEKLLEMVTSTLTFVSKMPSEVTALAPRTNAQGFESHSMSTLEANDALAVGTGLAVTFNSPLPSVTASSSMDVDVETVSRLVPWTARSSSQVEASSPNLVVTTGDGPSLGTEPHNPIHESLSPGPGSFPALSTPKAWTSTASLETATSLEDPGPAGLTLESERNPQATPTPAITLPPASTLEVCTTASPSPPDTTTEGRSVKAGTASVSDQVPSSSSLFPTSESSYLKVFNLKFTILNLFYTTDMGQRGSSKFNSIEDVLQPLINNLFRKSSFGPHYFGCRLTLLRSMKNRIATGVDVECAYQEDSSTPVLDREKIYWELSEQTHGKTRLGPYILHKESLYVDGYTHQIPTTTTNTWRPSLEAFTLNFTITNLLYTEDMGQKDSIKFKSTEKILQNMLGPLFENSSLGSSYSRCKLTFLRPLKNLTVTEVGVICLYQSDSTGPFLDRERVYWEFSNQTGGITRLGPYTLDRDSLYLNRYNHHLQSSTSTPIQTTIPSRISSAPSLLTNSSASGRFSLESFTLNFTITNLLCTADMGRPGSQKFNATERVLEHLLSPLLENSSLGSDYSGCRLTMLRPVQNGTATEFLCGHWKSPATPSLDRKKIYWELSNQTQGITRLGAYTLDNKSLYLDGYSYQMNLSSSTSAGGPNFEPFTLKFTITNMRYTADMGERGSSIFLSTERVLQRLLSSLFEKSSLGSQDFASKLTLLRPMKEGRATLVHFTCIHRRDPASSVLDREKIYCELSYLTWSITRLGPYTLEKDSLYLNGYNHLAVAPTKMPPDPAVAPGCPLWATEPGGSQAASLSFQSFTTIPEVLYTEDMHLSGSDKFNFTKRTLQQPLKNGSETGVSCLYTHKRNVRSSFRDKEKVYWDAKRTFH